MKYVTNHIPGMVVLIWIHCNGYMEKVELCVAGGLKMFQESKHWNECNIKFHFC